MRVYALFFYTKMEISHVECVTFLLFFKAQTGQEEQIKLYRRDSRDGQLSLERRSNSGTERSVDAGRKKGPLLYIRCEN